MSEVQFVRGNYQISYKFFTAYNDNIINECIIYYLSYHNHMKNYNIIWNFEYDRT